MSYHFRNHQQLVASRKAAGFWAFPPPGPGAFAAPPDPHGPNLRPDGKPRRPTPACAGHCGRFVHQGKGVRLKGGSYLCPVCAAGKGCPK